MQFVEVLVDYMEKPMNVASAQQVAGAVWLAAMAAAAVISNPRTGRLGGDHKAGIIDRLIVAPITSVCSSLLLLRRIAPPAR